MPSSANYVRDYTQERLNESASRKQARSDRNKARRMAAAYYGAAAIQGKDVDHKTPISKGGKTTLGNLRPAPPAENRSFKRNSQGGLVSQISRKESSRKR